MRQSRVSHHFQTFLSARIGCYNTASSQAQLSVNAGLALSPLNTLLPNGPVFCSVFLFTREKTGLVDPRVCVPVNASTAWLGVLHGVGEYHCLLYTSPSPRD